ncbi:MAG: M15 family metallopeptidase [Herbaspirillum sp.]|uniref:M15 family metallopeptidase n=1 Tax=Herbaspirillum sp. TaxID=1890675 RepID=UPI00258C45BD|nr:M15 family metallopeptidase [Herbaspirillum sp.]MCP3654215.1 M15 family metallopeptidase [Herbaspirillum sp.]
MRRYSKRSLGNLKGIHPDLRRVIDRALQEGPLDFIVIEGLRTMQRQRELVASGASQTMNSRHLTGHAVDLLPIGKDGAAFDWPLYDKLGPAVKAAAEAEGVKIEWGGDWQKFRDGPHFQLAWDEYPTEEWVTGDDAPKPRKKTQSTTLQAAAGAATAGAGGVATVLGSLDPVAQYILLGAASLAGLFLLWIVRERLRKWGQGDR